MKIGHSHANREPPRSRSSASLLAGHQPTAHASLHTGTGVRSPSCDPCVMRVGGPADNTVTRSSPPVGPQPPHHAHTGTTQHRDTLQHRGAAGRRRAPDHNVIQCRAGNGKAARTRPRSAASRSRCSDLWSAGHMLLDESGVNTTTRVVAPQWWVLVRV